MKITITKSISDILPEFNIIAQTMEVELADVEELHRLISETEIKIASTYDLTSLLEIKRIKDARNGYKRLGKDPSRCHLAVESLYRRIIKGNHLYKINNIVDAGNMLSIITQCSTAIVDYDKIVGDVLIRKGLASDDYEGIGRGKINVTNIPLYVDEISPFGSPTSDTQRTMITNDTKKILVMVIAFSSVDEQTVYHQIEETFTKFAKAKNIKKILVEKE